MKLINLTLCIILIALLCFLAYGCSIKKDQYVERFIIITHPQYDFDKKMLAKEEIEKSKKGKVSHVLFSNMDKIYINKSDKDIYVFSGSGEHDLKTNNRHIEIMGGYFFACLFSSFESTIYLNSSDESDLNIYFNKKAIYYNERETLNDKINSNEGFFESFVKRIDREEFSFSVYNDGIKIYETKGKRKINIYFI